MRGQRDDDNAKRARGRSFSVQLFHSLDSIRICKLYKFLTIRREHVNKHTHTNTNSFDPEVHADYRYLGLSRIARYTNTNTHTHTRSAADDDSTSFTHSHTHTLVEQLFCCIKSRTAEHRIFLELFHSTSERRVTFRGWRHCLLSTRLRHSHTRTHTCADAAHQQTHTHAHTPYGNTVTVWKAA